ncbi:putative ribosome biogenesis protein tsr1 (20S rRNA accumulation protein 1) [Fasciola gigantica]|uniref:Pre-rRNA-processing protein TSR1 homolog n=1 Tax=Fasciola gigantica TaxID=46835 RepID=A0A504YTN6_FASGI|nr:putative ribosome biogenesis protein tsr1 (20S rRNA accumulation protein 1) [Fasciola gigantica]
MSELKKFMESRGSVSVPILCVIVPLTEAVPAQLAQVLLRGCDPNAVDVRNQADSLQQVSHFHSPLLGKYFSLVTAEAGDLFGCLDLVKLADRLILVLPSSYSRFDESADRFLTALYAQGMVNTSFVVMSSSCDLKELRDSVQTKFKIPENEVHPLNNDLQALNLLRRICLAHLLCGSSKLAKTPEGMTTMCTHSSARFRAGLLADSVSLSGSFSQSEGSSEYLHISGQLKGAPLFLFEPLEQPSPNSPTPPVIYLPGWGDFPLHGVFWSDNVYGTRRWSYDMHSLAQSAEQHKCTSSKLNVIGDVGADSDQSDDSIDMEQHSGSEIESEPSDYAAKVVKGNIGSASLPPIPMDASSEPEDEQNLDFDDALTSYAARTMASSCRSVFSSAQLAKFRAARMEEMFPDEVETPPNVPARERFAKYRCLPRFQGSVWPVDKDRLPDEYENIACFRNYHRNRRSVIRYMQKRITKSLSEEISTALDHSQVIKHVPPGVRLELALGPISPDVASAIVKHHTAVPLGTKSKRPAPLIAWSLLPHESRISVCHFSMHRVNSALRAVTDLAVVATAANKAAEAKEKAALASENITLGLGEEACSWAEQGDEEIRRALADHQSHRVSVRKAKIDPTNPILPPEVEPIKSKELMLFQVGVRRFISAPIYSTATASPHEKAKYEVFFSSSQNDMIASVYAPVMYSPANVLQFRIRVDEDEEGNLGQPYVGELVATGSLHSVDPMRLTIKRIMLSGHPFKIQQRQAVVRFMFFNPVDVEYFKTVPLETKNGAVGHIKEPVGTHGLMKCVFDRPINASDVVLMPLYRRVFPKNVYRPRTTTLEDVSLPEKISSCYVSKDTIQLRMKGETRPGDMDEQPDHGLMSVFV